MRKLLSMLALMLAMAFIPFVHADTGSAATRYEADKKLCAEESTSDLRMKCLRDARAEYDKALPAQGSGNKVQTANTGTSSCPGCGKVISVTVGERKGKGTALGIVGGGVAGALLGNQIGHGTGRTVATVAGAAGGAYAGDKIEESVRTTKYWAVRVRLDSGEERTVRLDHDPGLVEGDLVTVSGNRIARR